MSKLTKSFKDFLSSKSRDHGKPKEEDGNDDIAIVPDSEPESTEPNDVIDEGAFFSDITGVSEPEFKKLFEESDMEAIQKIITVKEEDALKGLTDVKKRSSDEGGAMYKCGAKRIMINSYNAGIFYFPTIEELTKYAKKTKKVITETPTFHIIVPTGEDYSQVDITQVQTSRANTGATFQVASNLNTMEPPNEETTPDDENFVTIYLEDKTQGPMASISAAPAAISRVYCMFHNENDPSTWSQSSESQISMVSRLNDYYTTSNGYVVNYGGEKSFAEKDLDKLCQKVRIGIQYQVDAIFGKRVSGKMDKVKKPVCINQVFCAAMNEGQGESGSQNKELDAGELKMRLLQRACYQGTYLSAICMKSKKLFLTLVGGGVFGNSLEIIAEEIGRAHMTIGANKKINGIVSDVYLLLYSPTEKMVDTLVKKLKEAGVELVSNDEKITEKIKG